jgi:signal transduction histidine kinase
LNQNLSKPGPDLATISAKIKNLKLRNKLALAYTITFIVIVGVTFCIIYVASENFRKEDFFKRLRNTTISKYKLLVEVDEINLHTLQLFDKNSTSTISDRQILIFDSSGRIIYNYGDNPQVTYPVNAIHELHAGKTSLEFTDDKYEVVAMKFQHKGQAYYGITRAFDQSGKQKLAYLKLVMLSSFLIVTVLTILLSFYLAGLITKPITKLTKDLEFVAPDNLSIRVPGRNVKDEIGFLTDKFNELLNRLESAFKFQYHFIHHLSHELKTPLAIMMSNTERALAEDDKEVLTASLQFQKNALMELSGIINAMMDISKSESQLSHVFSDHIRIDELLFECMDEVNMIKSGAVFDFKVDERIGHSDNLTVIGNLRMLKLALVNLLKNATNFSEQMKPVVELRSEQEGIYLKILNDGALISDRDREHLFTHMYRGENSTKIKGFGLGLVLAKRIISLHHGKIEYTPENGLNCFNILIPIHS